MQGNVVCGAVAGQCVGSGGGGGWVGGWGVEGGSYLEGSCELFKGDSEEVILLEAGGGSQQL